MNRKILAIGELLIDGITHIPVQDLSQATALHIHPGGSPGNFCRYLHRLGTDAILVATVGKDGFGRILRQKVAQEGIDTQYITQSKQHYTSFIAVARTGGTPDFIPYRDADMYIPAIAPALIDQARLVHTTAFALSKEPARAHILQAFEKAYQLGIPVSVDWNYARPIWGEEDDAPLVFEQLQLFRPLFKFSLDDIERFTGTRLTIEDACTWLGKLKASCICLTCGNEGVYYRGGDERTWHFQPAEKIEVKNATGAGDAFWAGFISAYCSGASLENAIANGIRVASLKLQDKWHLLQA